MSTALFERYFIYSTSLFWKIQKNLQGFHYDFRPVSFNRLPQTTTDSEFIIENIVIYFYSYVKCLFKISINKVVSLRTYS